MIFEYNTQKEHLILKEYGRNIQKLVNFIRNTKDKEKRNQYAKTLVELMRQISPNSKETVESNQKLWDDLFIMADFDLDVDSPFPIPEKDILNKKPLRLEYSRNDIFYKHYGKNIELLIKKAIDLEDEEERESAVIYIGKLMKSFYSTWNKDNIEDEAIAKNIRDLSKGSLTVDLEKVKENNLFEVLYKERRPSNKGRKSHKSNGKRRRN